MRISAMSGGLWSVFKRHDQGFSIMKFINLWSNSIASPLKKVCPWIYLYVNEISLNFMSLMQKLFFNKFRNSHLLEINKNILSSINDWIKILLLLNIIICNVKQKIYFC